MHGSRFVADLIVDGQSFAALLLGAGRGRSYNGWKHESW